MNETDFNALIHLLDDDDPEVAAHVWEKLMSMGREGVTRLEQAWYLENDPHIQRKLEDLIQRINTREVTRELLEWRKQGGNDLLRGWFLVTRLSYPDLDLTQYRNEINRLVNKTWLEINDRMDPHEKLKVLNHILFVMEQYKPNKEDITHPNNAFLNQVFEQRRGNALTLNFIYHLICLKLDLPVSCVLPPGYCIQVYNDGNTEFFVDVVNGGMFFNRKDLSRFLEEMKVPEKPSYFKPTSNIYLILQLLNNLVVDYRKHDNEEKAKEIEEVIENIAIKFDGGSNEA